jgi:predicted DNA-binding transcriptional regulator AlpA
MELTTVQGTAGRRNAGVDRAWKVRQVAELFDMTERTVWRMIAAGELKAERLSARCTRIFDSEIERFRESRKAKAA